MKKKALLLVGILIIALTFSTVLVACNPDKMENIVGTYKLVVDTRTQYEQETVDNIATYGREAYIVLTGEDYGYYIYKDNDTPLCARKVKLEYTLNDENQVTLISYILGEGVNGKTFNVDSRDRIALISRWPSASKIIDAYDVRFNKVSDKTDLSTVKEAYGELPVFDYDLYQYNSTYYAEITNNLQKNFSKYIYKYYAVDSAKCTATLYYALKEDKIPVVEKNIAVSFTRDQETNKPVKMTIGDVEYDLTSGLPTRPVQVTVSDEVVDVEEQLCWFNYSEVAPEDYDAYFLGLIEEYEQSLKNAE